MTGRDRFAQTCHMWDFAALSLCDRYHVIALDQRGHGDSDWAPDGDYSLDAQYRDLHGIVTALKLRDLVLMGLSMGGRNAIAYAAGHPERVRALVIVEAAPQHEQSGAERVRRFVQAEDELDSIDEFVARARRYNPRRPVEQTRNSLLHNLRQLPTGKWTWKYDKALRSPDRQSGGDPQLAQRLWGYMDKVRCPTLVVRGEESDVVSEGTAKRMGMLIRRSRVVTVRNAGHLVPGDNPSDYQRAIAEFLDEIEGGVR